MNKFIEALKKNKAKLNGKVVNKKTETLDTDLTLSELREKYPNISARSKAEFLNKISDEN